MAIELDGIEYTSDTATDNALNLLNYINNWMVANNITNSSGVVIQYIVNISSPIWLIILGLGYMLTIFQRLIYAAGQAFSIPNCSELQVLNLAEIKGTSLLEGSATIIECIVTAGTGGICPITHELVASITYEGTELTFRPIYEINIPANTAATVILQASVNGPFYIPAGAITAFITPPANFLSMTSKNAAPGEHPETIAILRSRLQNKFIVSSGINACIDAIRNLTGVQTANLYFNTSTVDSLIIGPMTIPPRCCGMFVQGYNENIATTYFAYINVPCVGGTQSQVHTTLSGQDLVITYSLPAQVDLYIKIKVRIPATLIVPDGYQNAIKALLLPASNSQLIGVDYTQVYLNAYLTSFVSTDISIVGLTVSQDNITFSDTTDLNKNEVGIITAANIFFEEIV